jgi:hypothetical protein
LKIGLVDPNSTVEIPKKHNRDREHERIDLTGISCKEKWKKTIF